MTRRLLMLATTAIAVWSDSMLAPFYPRLFAEAFGVTDPRAVGAYVAATCLVVLLAYPGWARLADRVPTLSILVATQLAAGLLSIACAVAPDLASFLVASLGMLVFKASYLLVYPYLLRVEPKSSHARTIGVLTVIVHLGAIGGATVGGAVLELAQARDAFLVMAAGDFAQMAACAAIVRGLVPSGTQGASAEDDAEPPTDGAARATPAATLARLGAVMFLFYFCVFLPRPFFAEYWVERSGRASDVLAGLAFAIPAWMSLLALAADGRSSKHASPGVSPSVAMAAAVVGLALQALPSVPAIVAGRCISGLAIFRAMVRLDAILFEISHPSAYAADFGRINVCQQLGALTAAFVAGGVRASAGGAGVFALAAAGLAGTAIVHARFFRAETSPAEPEGATTP